MFLKPIPVHKVRIKPKIDELFCTFISLPETQTFMKILLSSAREGTLDEFISTTLQQPSNTTQPPLSPGFPRQSRLGRDADRSSISSQSFSNIDSPTMGSSRHTSFSSVEGRTTSPISSKVKRSSLLRYSLNESGNLNEKQIATSNKQSASTISSGGSASPQFKDSSPILETDRISIKQSPSNSNDDQSTTTKSGRMSPSSFLKGESYSERCKTDKSPVSTSSPPLTSKSPVSSASASASTPSSSSTSSKVIGKNSASSPNPSPNSSVAAQLSHTSSSVDRQSISIVPPNLFTFTPDVLASPPDEQIDIIHSVFSQHPEGLTLPLFREELIKQAFELPVWFARPLFRRMKKGIRMNADNKLRVARFVRDEKTAAVWEGSPSLPPFSSKSPHKLPVLTDEEEMEEELARLMEGKSDGGAAASSGTSTLTALDEGLLSEKSVLAFYNDYLRGLSRTERAFNVVRKQHNQFITPTDWKPFLEDLLDVHPGLDFLRRTPEFQQRYLETVTVRMFYTVNRAEDERMTLAELNRSDLVEVCHVCDEEPNINHILRFFSYEHFYVIYCKFWELDQDHDQLISDTDLFRYGNYSLTHTTIDRIINQQAPRRLKSPVPGKMCFEDFIWFLLSEEDKTTDTAVAYWFRVVDLDGDGVLSAWEMEQCYAEQLERVEAMGMEQVNFEDVLVQLVDMIHPKGRHVPRIDEAPAAREARLARKMGGEGELSKQGASSFDPSSVFITLADMLSSKLSCFVFNVLTNHNKYITFETKEPFGVKDQTNQMSDWERFALAEYERLSVDDEDTDEMGGSELTDDLDGH
ncbi:putative calcium ion binding protein [Monocercomonoides exilis]|uniref:putative calcium ion binding protein n=1 Tax=Monocercomonoides exilis TaxID=2049356 RepID=UPI0035597C9C|nr:putative calcium ion binding protein [Monocercomonoides exilis]|eukprot:MONOS_3873.1-p1 / transcript=MONOS_3873.1 / gene=MONOS_3873 / organism=Monocercomonoides_exilis_PA203 / gene_product=calcium ion binding protein, putative / transcript_product=calcium ion binding protein, putative / location=Mono_scaffold00095:77866-81094(-) / protein_length=808 / sequence_SO=supercontig / SO=protein_coding / is_pseudo=false